MGVGKRRRRPLFSKAVWWGMISVALIFGVKAAHDFLAVSKPVGEGVLVVEAWVPARALAESAHVFNSGRYSCLVLVGGPVRGTARNSNYLTTYDDLAEDRLENIGFDTKKLVKIHVPTEPVGRRTLSSATAVTRWLSSSGTSVCCVDVFTVGEHARKTWVFFRYALGDRYRVGIISGSEASYTRTRFWFLSKKGIWIFARDLVGYFYSKLWVLVNGERTL
jgi:hypothetical protein